MAQLVNNAVELLKDDHPLHKTFAKWCKARHKGEGEAPRPSKRTARKFLQAHPQFSASKQPETKPTPPPVVRVGPPVGFHTAQARRVAA